MKDFESFKTEYEKEILTMHARTGDKIMYCAYSLYLSYLTLNNVSIEIKQEFINLAVLNF